MKGKTFVKIVNFAIHYGHGWAFYAPDSLSPEKVEDEREQIRLLQEWDLAFSARVAESGMGGIYALLGEEPPFTVRMGRICEYRHTTASRRLRVKASDAFAEFEIHRPGKEPIGFPAKFNGKPLPYADSFEEPNGNDHVVLRAIVWADGKIDVEELGYYAERHVWALQEALKAFGEEDTQVVDALLEGL